MLDFVLIAVFAVHLLAVNIAMAGPLWCVWLSRRESRHGDAVAGDVGHRLAKLSLAGIALGVGLGLALWGLVSAVGGQQRYAEAMAQIPAARWWGIASEIVFFAVSLSVYVALWNRFHRRWWHRGIAIVASTTLVSHFPPLFTIISAVSMRSDLAGRTIDRPLYYSLLLDGEIAARTIHHWLAAITVAGIAVMLLCLRRMLRSPDASASIPESPREIVLAARGSLVATLCQLPVGAWVLFALPATARDQILGDDILGAVLMIAGVLGAIGLMHHLAAIALGDTRTEGVIRVAVLLAIVTVLMVATLHRVRTQAYERMGLAALFPLTVEACPKNPNVEARNPKQIQSTKFKDANA